MLSSEEFMENFLRERHSELLWYNDVYLEHIYEDIFGLINVRTRLMDLCLLEDWDGVSDYTGNQQGGSYYKDFYYSVKAYKRELKISEVLK